MLHCYLQLFSIVRSLRGISPIIMGRSLLQMARSEDRTRLIHLRFRKAGKRSSGQFIFPDLDKWPVIE